MSITYKINEMPSAEDVIELYENAGLPRPTDDKERIKKMYENSNLVITAWYNNVIIGVSRCITDWVWSCYLADLAVRKDYQKSGIGKKLISLTKEKIGEQCMLLLLSVPSAMEYNPKAGFKKQENCFMINRLL